MTALRIRDVRLLVGAVGLSAFGDFMLWIPLALHIEAMTGSALAVSGFFLALFGPVVALGAIAGRLADRFENARLLWTASLDQDAVVALMALTPDSLAAVLLLTVGVEDGGDGRVREQRGAEDPQRELQAVATDALPEQHEEPGHARASSSTGASSSP